MNKQSYKRQNVIRMIKATLKIIKDKNLKYDIKKFLIEICAMHGVSKRTAKDYLDVAQSGVRFQNGIQPTKTMGES